MNFIDLIKNEGKRITKKKGQHIFRQGSKNGSLYWIESGLLKAYYTTCDGKELIKSFITHKDIIGSLSSAYTGNTCSFSLACLEDTTLVEIPFTVIHQHSRSDQTIANHMIETLLQFAMKKEQREFEFLCLSPEERYQKMIAESPGIINKITQADLAKYLGITAVGLSRIKKRVSLENTSAPAP